MHFSSKILSRKIRLNYSDKNESFLALIIQISDDDSRIHETREDIREINDPDKVVIFCKVAPAKVSNVQFLLAMKYTNADACH